MPVVDIVIFGHTHRLTCQAGEEERLKYLAGRFRNYAETALKGLPTADHRLVYLVAALTLLDEMEEKAAASASNGVEITIKLIRDKILSLKAELD